MPGGRESWTGNLHIKSSFQPIATCEPYLDPDSESTNCEEKKKKKEKLWQLEVWTLDWIFCDWGISGRFLDVVIVLWLSWKGSYLLAIHTLTYRWNGKMSWMCFKMRGGGLELAAEGAGLATPWSWGWTVPLGASLCYSSNYCEGLSFSTAPFKKCLLQKGGR